MERGWALLPFIGARGLERPAAGNWQYAGYAALCESPKAIVCETSRPLKMVCV